MSIDKQQGKTGPIKGGCRRLPRELHLYQDLGLSLIPINPLTKTPPVRWTRYRYAKASSETIRRWHHQDYGFAVIFGEPSNNLVSRDFDTTDSYERWASGHRSLAMTLPTVRTRRGMHVYATACPDNVRESRKALNKPADGTGAIKVHDGELRPGPGCYSLLPPSRHPSGSSYEWVVGFNRGFPEIDLLESGFFDIPHDVTETTEVISVGRLGVWDGGNSNLSIATSLYARVTDAALATQPYMAGERNNCLFQYARRLKAVPSLMDAPAIACIDHVRYWHELALPVIATKAFEETWSDFRRQWESVRFPGGNDQMRALLGVVRSRPLPRRLDYLQNESINELMGLCKELQCMTGRDQPFFLSCRTVAGLFGVEPMTGARWLKHLVNEGVMRIVDAGTYKSLRATRYIIENPEGIV
jgi:hypothetical protein